MILLGAVPIICLILIFLVLPRNQTPDGSWGNRFLLSALIWGSLLTTITEVCSLFRSINTLALIVGWVFGTVLIGFLVHSRDSGNPASQFTLPKLSFEFQEFSRRERFCLIYLLATAIITLVTAWLAPPNTADSLAYHMSRVMHWIQDRSVSFYPTSIPRQLYQNPWAEYAILHFQLLSGGDRFANLIQWGAMIGCVIGVSEIARQFGANREGQIFAATVCATIPMGILQSTGTQNNYVLSFWLITLIYYINRFRQTKNFYYSLAIGASLGLSILTKATAYIFAFPFMLWMVFSVVKPLKPAGIKYIFAATIFALTLNAGHLYRTYELTGRFLGPNREGTRYYYTNETISPRLVASNIVRNLALHLGTPSDFANAKIMEGVERIHKDLLHVDINDKRITWLRTRFYVFKLRAREDYDGNPFHLLLLFFASIYLLSFMRKELDIWMYSSCVTLGFLIFCMILRWQPWHSRLHLPLFVLWSPVLGIILGKIKAPLISYGYILLLMLVSIPYLLLNESRPILGEESIFLRDRNSQYIFYDENISTTYATAAKISAEEGCPDIGLSVGMSDFEYVLWVFLKENCAGKIYRIEHINVANESAGLNEEYDMKHFSPKIIIATMTGPLDIWEYHGQSYHLAWSQKPLSVFVR